MHDDQDNENRATEKQQQDEARRTDASHALYPNAFYGDPGGGGR
jgi:hypothetical protein